MDFLIDSWTELLFLMLGLVVLLGGSEVTVSGAQTLARRWKIPELVIGLTVLALGSDLPEIATNIQVALDLRQGADPELSGLALGNVLGSSLSQITLVTGITGLFAHLYISKQTLQRDGSALVTAMGLLIVLSLDGQLSWVDGLILCLFYLLYLLVLSNLLRKNLQHRGLPTGFMKVVEWLHPSQELTEEQVEKELEKGQVLVEDSRWWGVLYDLVRILVGLVAVIMGAEMVVKNGESLARSYDIHDALIGVFIGVATSLPELMISLKAVQKGSPGISIGNLVGSNIVDTTVAVGIGALFAPLMVDDTILFFQMPFVAVGTVMTLLVFYNHRDLDKSESWVLILLYGLFLWMSVVMG